MDEGRGSGSGSLVGGTYNFLVPFTTVIGLDKPCPSTVSMVKQE